MENLGNFFEKQFKHLCKIDEHQRESMEDQ